MGPCGGPGANRLVTFNLEHLESYTKEFGIEALSPPAAWKEVQNSQ